MTSGWRGAAAIESAFGNPTGSTVSEGAHPSTSTLHSSLDVPGPSLFGALPKMSSVVEDA